MNNKLQIVVDALGVMFLLMGVGHKLAGGYDAIAAYYISYSAVMLIIGSRLEE